MREHIMNLYISNHVIIGRLSELNTLLSHHVHFTFQKCLVSKTNKCYAQQGCIYFIKNTVKLYICEILQFKIAVFYLSIF